MANSQLSRTQGLSDEEKKEAKSRILHRASELGMDTKDWDIHAASLTFTMQAMALNMPDEEHPNKMPFSGILTRVDEPSDEPPGGATGKRVLIPSAVAEAALGTLMGMGVDCTPDFKGHDNRFKIGVITEALVEGNALHISGFLYAVDFPEECSRIKSEQSAMGFSYECQVAISDKHADPWTVDQIVFTGAAILYKKDAAYHTTSLAATAEQELDMSSDELKALNDSVAKIAASLGVLVEKQAATDEKIESLKAKGASLAGPIIDQAMPHVMACNAAADSMEAAGIGTHPTMGHAAVLRKVGASILHAATMGKLPHIYNDHSYFGNGMEAAADPKVTEALKAAADKAEAAAKQSADQMAALNTKLADLEAAAKRETPEPVRKTYSAQATQLMSKFNLKADGNDSLTVANVDAALEAAGVKGRDAMTAKLKLHAAGAL